MKTSNFILIFIFIFGLFLLSCESDNEIIHNNTGTKDTIHKDTIKTVYKFKIKFSDSTQIVENDILFYDSSSHFLFLKNDLDFNQSITGFSVLINSDTIYKGIKYSCFLSSPPSSTFFISDCFLYGNDIVDLGFCPYSKDLRNDQRIINALKYDNILRNGLSCHIDSIKVISFDKYSEVTCKITITNNDKFNYYILDPSKMGELDFNYYTGGLSFQNIDSKLRSFLMWSISKPDWEDLTMNDFSILLSNSKKSYTFKSSDYNKMEKGIYKATFSFCGTKQNTSDFDLEQINGRIWVGEASSEMDSIIVE